jgi:hypothetical protein
MFERQFRVWNRVIYVTVMCVCVCVYMYICVCALRYVIVVWVFMSCWIFLWWRSDVNEVVFSSVAYLGYVKFVHALYLARVRILIKMI